MARHDKYYNQLGCTVTINGVGLQDYSDGNSIRFRSGGDETTLTKGTDGATVNLANDKTGTFEIDLKETSLSNDYLSSLLTAQRGTIYLDLVGVMIDGSGAIHAGSGGTIKKAADVDTGGPAMGKRTWIIEFPQVQVT